MTLTIMQRKRLWLAFAAVFFFFVLTMWGQDQKTVVHGGTSTMATTTISPWNSTDTPALTILNSTRASLIVFSKDGKLMATVKDGWLKIEKSYTAEMVVVRIAELLLAGGNR